MKRMPKKRLGQSIVVQNVLSNRRGKEKEMNCKYKWNDYCLECVKLVERIVKLNKNKPENLEYIIDKANRIVALKMPEGPLIAGENNCCSKERERGVRIEAEQKINDLQAENDRLKAELADSLPLGKVREMVEYCDAGICEKCKYMELCDSLGILSECPADLLNIPKLEQYVKEVRGE